MTAATQVQNDAFRSWMALTTASTEETTAACLSAAITKCELWTGLTLTRDAADRTESFEGEGGTLLYPAIQPLYTVTSLTIADQTIALSTDWKNQGYWLDGNAVKLRGYTFDGWCVLVYKGGYLTTSIPKDLMQSIYEYAAGLYDMQNHIGVKSKTLASENVTFKDSMLSDTVKEIWNAYRLVRL